MPANHITPEREDVFTRMAEIMKLLRSEAMSLVEIRRGTGWSSMTSVRWAKQLEAHGILQSRTAASGKRRVYFLSHHWGGSA